MPKRRLTLLSILLKLLGCTMQLNAQTEQPTDKAIGAKFEMFYNEGKYDSIFNMYSPAMQKEFPLDVTAQFYAKLNRQAGKIVQRVFEKYNLSWALYRTAFETSLYTMNIAVDKEQKIGGLAIRPYEPDSFAAPARNVTQLDLPFNGEWWVIWGGDTKEQNHHIGSRAQKNAFDLVIRDRRGMSYKTDGKTNEDYYAFGQEIIAPCDGEVVEVIDNVPDNVPGIMNRDDLTGNTVILKTANNEYLLFAHFKLHTIQVKRGQQVKQNELLGLCGNSGNSSEPHLHFHIQNIPYMNVATGVKCYFAKILVNGVVTTHYSPVKGDRLQRVKK